MLSRAGSEWESRSGSIHASGPALPAPARKRGSRNPESRPSGAESQGKYCSVRWKRTRLSRHKARNRKESIVVCAGSARDYHLPFGQEIKKPAKSGLHVSAPNGSRPPRARVLRSRSGSGDSASRASMRSTLADPAPARIGKVA